MAERGAFEDAMDAAFANVRWMQVRARFQHAALNAHGSEIRRCARKSAAKALMSRFSSMLRDGDSRSCTVSRAMHMIAPPSCCARCWLPRHRCTNSINQRARLASFVSFQTFILLSVSTLAAIGYPSSAPATLRAKAGLPAGASSSSCRFAPPFIRSPFQVAPSTDRGSADGSAFSNRTYFPSRLSAVFLSRIPTLFPQEREPAAQQAAALEARWRRRLWKCSLRLQQPGYQRQPIGFIRRSAM